jgi:hypothetical protein
MNRLLRKVARELRYRPMPDLVGRVVTINSAETAPSAIEQMLVGSFPRRPRFIGPEEPWMTISLAKYCILDLTFAVDGIEWQPSDDQGTSVLKQFGFACHSDELSEDQRRLISQNNDSTCISELAEDIDEGHRLLRLFLEEVPRRELLDYWKQLMKAGKGRLFEGGADEMKMLLADFFPHQMQLTDACLTNAEFIWFHKHSYL